MVIATMLCRLWRRPASPWAFRPLAAQLALWAGETIAAKPQWSDVGLVEEGLRLFEELSRASSDDLLLATDLHAGNVLRAQREPWLVIDPKPFIGDRAYDATQHLLNCPARLRADPRGTIRRLADLLESTPTAFACGCSRARRRSRATRGMTIRLPWRERSRDRGFPRSCRRPEWEGARRWMTTPAGRTVLYIATRQE